MAPEDIMKTQDLSYSDGANAFVGYLAYDDAKSGARPGVVVVHDAMGVGPCTMANARRLADLGYIALCLDMYGGRPLARSQEEMRKLVGPLVTEAGAVRRRANVGLSALTALPQVDAKRVAGIGYCLGGSTVLEMARSGAALAGVVSFHGTLTTKEPATPGTVKAKVLVLTGAEDPFAPADHVTQFQAEMTAAGADWQVVTYGGAQHAFAMPDAATLEMPGIKYSKLIDQRSWRAMLSFFDEIFS
jgi:dienelactone hydrolase